MGQIICTANKLELKSNATPYTLTTPATPLPPLAATAPTATAPTATAPTTPSLPLPLTPNLTTSQAAEILGVQPSTLEQWRWQGKGPPYLKLSRSVRYRPSDLSVWLEERVYNSTTEAQASETT